MPSYKELELFPTPKQAQLLLYRLVQLNPFAGNTFSAYNYERTPADLANGFPHSEARAVTELLLGAPWN